MDMPLFLRDAVDERAAQYKLSLLKGASAAMTQRYKEESGAGKRLVTRSIETAAYAAVRMPATFGAVSEALSGSLASLPQDMPGKIRTVLDVGAGTGTVSWAVREVLGEGRHYTCLEREKSMIEYGRLLMELDPDLQKAEWVCMDMTGGIAGRQADLVAASYSLNELQEGKRLSVVDELWKAAGQMLLLIEPGTPEGFRQLRAAREYLLGKYKDAYVAAPCSGNITCPVSEDDWCHFTARVSRSRLHKAIKEADVPYEDEKYCYLAICRQQVLPAAARILRHPRKDAKCIGLLLCTPEGIVEKQVTKKHAKYKQARKASAGDAWEE